MFTIEFAALNFYNQNRVSYRYILEGYEKEWHYNGKNRIASYTNVPPGDYTFRVETVDEANPELVSNCTLSITILPPWWLSLVGNPYICNSRFGSSLFQPAPGFLHAQNEE